MSTYTLAPSIEKIELGTSPFSMLPVKNLFETEGG